jgi:uncharacterized protein YegP (UPF0339 family)
MKKEYDFSKGIRGKFYRGDKPFSVTIEGIEPRRHPRYEVFRQDNGKYRFRLRNDERILLESSNEFTSEGECEKAINDIKQESIIAPTVFA